MCGLPGGRGRLWVGGAFVLSARAARGRGQARARARLACACSFPPALSPSNAQNAREAQGFHSLWSLSVQNRASSRGLLGNQHFFLYIFFCLGLANEIGQCPPFSRAAPGARRARRAKIAHPLGNRRKRAINLNVLFCLSFAKEIDQSPLRAALNTRRASCVKIARPL